MMMRMVFDQRGMPEEEYRHLMNWLEIRDDALEPFVPSPKPSEEHGVEWSVSYIPPTPWHKTQTASTVVQFGVVALVTWAMTFLA